MTANHARIISAPRKLKEIKIPAVVIRRTEAGNTHAGMVFVGINGDFCVLELQTHLALKVGPAKPKYWTLALFNDEIDPLALKMINAKCVLFERVRPQIPYAFRHNDDTVFDFSDENISLLLGEGQHGLTCSTLLAAICASVGYRIINSGTWTPRPEDEGLKMAIVASIVANPKCTPEHAAIIRGEAWCPRIRPEEVAGATISDAYPCVMSDAVAASKLVLESL